MFLNNFKDVLEAYSLSKICKIVLVSWNNLEELQKPPPPSVSIFDILLMDSKFRNFPPLLFRPPPQNRLAENPAEQHSTTWIRTEQNPPNVEIFVDVSAKFPHRLGEAGWGVDQFFEILWTLLLS